MYRFNVSISPSAMGTYRNKLYYVLDHVLFLFVLDWTRSVNVWIELVQKKNDQEKQITEQQDRCILQT